jgi:hypothetical protein
MVREDLCKDLSDNKSVDSEINDLSIMSISEIDEIDQNIEEINQNIEEIDQNENVIEDILEDSGSELNEEKPEAEINVNYPNEAYGDLMSLVTKYKVNNVTGNAIIKFFNKHANLDKSPLPISIEQGRKHMDNMKLPSLTYTKTCVMNYNNKEYFLYHKSLINCIKNILSISDMSQNFALTFEKVEVIILYFHVTYLRIFTYYSL